ncbi:MTAP family purine nucleoside phosphorylase, partial [Candidatus Woesearchaeota archaeon]|nr:MTAP family purine nucleoside phosphorylase [Candidatus Woesearchaeota archaeon]
VPELILCKQMEIPYCSICSNVNYAEGLDKTPVSHEQTNSVMDIAAPKMLRLVEEILKSY